MPHARVADAPIEDRAAYSLGEVAGLTGLSVSGLYLLINRRQLQSVRVGGRRLIRRQDLDAFLGGPEPTPAPIRSTTPSSGQPRKAPPAEPVS
jgi:excisionase family DNA binding protein